MKKKDYLTMLWVIALLMFLFYSSPGYAEAARGVSEDVIKIGIIADLTGPYAMASIPHTEGVKTYFEYINAMGGIHGRNLRMYLEDDRYSIPLSVAGFKKLLFKDKVFALLGSGGTGSSVTLFSQIKKEKVVTMSEALSEILVNPVKRHIFGFAATYKDQVNVMFDYIINDLKDKTPRIAIVYPDIEYGKVALRAARKRAEFYNIKLVSEEVLNPGAIEATSQVLRLKRAKAKYVIMQQVVPATIAFLKSARSVKFSALYFGSSPTCSEDIPKRSGKAAENFLGAHSFSPWYVSSPGMMKLREISGKYFPTKGKEIRPLKYIEGWVKAMIFVEGLKRAGKNLNTESIIASIESIKGFDTEGLTGIITYGPKNHKGGEYIRLYKTDIEQGLLTPIIDWRKPL